MAIIPRFDKLAFLRRLISQKERKECKLDSDHVVLPETIEKRLKDRNYRFIETCIHCRATIGFDCTYDDDGKLKISTRRCSSLRELQTYFSGIADNQYYEPHEAPHQDDCRLVEACKVCQGKGFQLGLCKDHLLEVALSAKFKDCSFDDAVAAVRQGHAPSMVSQAKIVGTMHYLLSELKGDDLTDFIRVLPSMMARLKIQPR